MILALLLFACGSADDTDKHDGSGTPTDTATSPQPLECAPPGQSSCGNEASILRGWVSLSPDAMPADTTGDLFVAITHLRLGQGNKGGVYHMHTIVPDVDLAAGPVEFAFDMCDDGEMWSEENCEYNLIAILDQNGSNSANSFLADSGEAAHREVIELSCHTESPCFDIQLDCLDGKDCIKFDEDATCSCAADSCASPIVTCN